MHAYVCKNSKRPIAFTGLKYGIADTLNSFCDSCLEHAMHAEMLCYLLTYRSIYEWF